MKKRVERYGDFEPMGLIVETLTYGTTESKCVRKGKSEVFTINFTSDKGKLVMIKKFEVYFFICCSANGYEWMRSKVYDYKANCKRAMKSFANKKWEIEYDNK